MSWPGLSSSIDDPAVMTDLIAAHMPISAEDKQRILETVNLKDRMNALLELMTRSSRCWSSAPSCSRRSPQRSTRRSASITCASSSRPSRRNWARATSAARSMDELRKKIEEAHMPEDALKEANRELDRLQRMSPGAPDYTTTRTYLDWLVAMPWDKATADNLDIPSVKAHLDADHYGLEKIKDRILEYLSVRKFKTGGDLRQPILCFAGPPGVGKTSLAKSIANAMGKKFVRISPGRHARRVRDSRPPAHLYRRAARPDHPGHQAGRDQQPAVRAGRD